MIMSVKEETKPMKKVKMMRSMAKRGTSVYIRMRTHNQYYYYYYIQERERERESEKMITFEEEGIPFVRVVVACLTVLWACHDPMGKQSGMERIPGSQGSSRPSSLLLH
jgi:hypothetical protein